MNLKERINADFITAFKEKDLKKKNFLGLLKGEIQLEETRPNMVPSDDLTLSMIRRMEKGLKQINTEESLSELVYLEPYLPKMMSEDQIRVIVNGYKSEGLTNVGQIMGRFNKEYKGLADNKLVSSIIAEN